MLSCSLLKAPAAVQLRARAEEISIPGHDDAFDAVVLVEEAVDAIEVFDHGVGVGIVSGRAVECHNDYGRYSY